MVVIRMVLISLVKQLVVIYGPLLIRVQTSAKNYTLLPAHLLLVLVVALLITNTTAEMFVV